MERINLFFSGSLGPCWRAVPSSGCICNRPSLAAAGQAIGNSVFLMGGLHWFLAPWPAETCILSSFGLCYGFGVFFWLWGFFLMDRHCLSGNHFPGKAGLSEQARRWNHAWEVRLFIALCTGSICEVVGGQHICGMEKGAGSDCYSVIPKIEGWVRCGGPEGGQIFKCWLYYFLFCCHLKRNALNFGSKWYASKLNFYIYISFCSYHSCLFSY